MKTKWHCKKCDKKGEFELESDDVLGWSQEVKQAHKKASPECHKKQNYPLKHIEVENDFEWGVSCT